jgi:tRNA synthetases class I (W and Y)
MSALSPPRCLRVAVSRLGAQTSPQFALQRRQFSITPLNLKKWVKKAFKKQFKVNSFGEDRFKTPPKRVYPELPALIPELKARGLVSQHTEYSHKSPNLGLTRGSLYDTKNSFKWSSLRAFCAIDPSSTSLHLGNLMTLMPLIHMSLRGHKTYILVLPTPKNMG